MPVSCAVIDNLTQLPGMVGRIFGGTPDAGDTEISAPTLLVIVGAVQLAPGVTAPDLDAPAMRLGVLQRGLDIFLGVRWSGHADLNMIG